ncbi:MAG: helix-turn-helix transcriptional regulator [Pseudomonadota bacterium]|nr:helix-turn-helix transcriptional regulator [Pseudomonadota bacterium]
MEIKIAKSLTALMKQRGLSLRELSKLSGVPPTTLNEWLSNRPPRNPVQIKKVAEALDVSLNFLLFNEEDKHDPLQRILVEDIFSGNFQITVKRLKFDK